MAALSRPTEATYEVHENVTVDTYDNEDHTFCGIVFPVQCKNELPLEHLIINSVSVRGRLGPISVWVSNNNLASNYIHCGASGGGNVSSNVISKFRFHPQFWTKVYNERNHPPSVREYKKLPLDIPIRLCPGDIKAIYIHSTLHSDQAIVYDNTPYYKESQTRYEDEKISIFTGRAHVSPVPFSNDSIWGWGGAWRDRREFVGSLDYGVIYKLWHPILQPKFPNQFQDCARLLFLCQRRWESPVSMLPDECIFYILNMCRWDWFKYDPINRIKWRRKKRDKKAVVTSSVAAAASSSSSGDGGSDGGAVMERSSSSRFKGALKKLFSSKKRN